MAKPVTKLRRARRASRWKLTDVANHLGISKARLCMAELQREGPLPLPLLLEYCKFVETDPVPIVIEAGRVADYVVFMLENHIQRVPELAMRMAAHFGAMPAEQMASMVPQPTESVDE